MKYKSMLRPYNDQCMAHNDKNLKHVNAIRTSSKCFVQHYDKLGEESESADGVDIKLNCISLKLI